MGGYHHGPTGIWLDEAAHIQAMPRLRVVDPLEIVCKRCGAVAGQRCTDTNYRKTFERKPHRRRKNDAQLAQEAANAMLSR